MSCLWGFIVEFILLLYSTVFAVESLYLFISFLYLYLYVLRDDTSIK